MNQVIAPLGGTLLLVVIDDITSGEIPKPRAFIGWAFVVIVLAMLSDPAPEIAIPLAWLVFIAVLVVRGVRVFARFTGKPVAKKPTGGGGQFAGHGASGSW